MHIYPGSVFLSPYFLGAEDLHSLKVIRVITVPWESAWLECVRRAGIHFICIPDSI